MYKCNWSDCSNESKNGIQSFDPFLVSKNNRSEVIPYCENHISEIRNGKYEENKLHQKYHYLMNAKRTATNYEDIHKQIKEIHTLYGL